jgi:hypothetical protein
LYRQYFVTAPILELYNWSEEYSIWVSPSSGDLRSSGSSSVFSGALIAEEVDEVGDKGSGHTTTDDVWTILEVFLNLPLRSANFIDKTFFLVKSNSWDYSPQVPDYQDY